MSLKPPAWIDNDYLRKSIQDGDENRQIVVRSYDISAAVPPGNNYGSNIWRAKIKYQEKPAEDILDLSLIVKAPLGDETLKEMLDKITQVEPIFYNKFLPLLADKSFAPKSVFSAVPAAIVMEDLSAQGYVMADRLNGLDYDHCRVYAVTSATFHAATVAAHRKHAHLVESLGKEKIFTNDQHEIIKGTKRLLATSAIILAQKMEDIEGFEMYADLVRNCSATLWDDLVAMSRKNETLNALGQGDPWTTNMMFRYDSHGKVNGVKLLDFQVLRYSSPVADLVFFIWVSAAHEVREEHLEDLYHLYCDSLNGKLQEFNCTERLSYDQLLAAVKGFYPLIMYVIGLMQYVKSVDHFDYGSVVKKALDDTVSDTTFSAMLSQYFTQTYCEEELTKYLRQLQSIGLFHWLKSR